MNHQTEGEGLGGGGGAQGVVKRFLSTASPSKDKLTEKLALLGLFLMEQVFSTEEGQKDGLVVGMQLQCSCMHITTKILRTRRKEYIMRQNRNICPAAAL